MKEGGREVIMRVFGKEMMVLFLPHQIPARSMAGHRVVPELIPR